MKPFLLKPGVVLATAGFAVAAPPSSYNKVQVESAFLFIQVEILKPGALSNPGSSLHLLPPNPPHHGYAANLVAMFTPETRAGNLPNT